MSTALLPVGKPTAFTGDITRVYPKATGFFYCKITTPTHLNHPILQRRIKTENVIRTIAGLGSWTGWLISYEYDKAIELGYTFEIIRGYKFERANIFKEYIDRLYQIRLEYSKDNLLILSLIPAGLGNIIDFWFMVN